MIRLPADGRSPQPRAVVYLSFWLERGGVDPAAVTRLLVVDDPAAPAASQDVVAELQALMPAAAVASATPDGVLGRAGELVVVVFGAPFHAPLDDVIYDHLDRLAALLPRLGVGGHVLLYRVWWREAEAVAATALPARLRRLRRERALIRLLRRVQAHRWLLRPRFLGN
jgi:hypothetical protein